MVEFNVIKIVGHGVLQLEGPHSVTYETIIKEVVPSFKVLTTKRRIR